MLWKFFVWAVVAIIGLFVISIAISILTTLLSFAITLISIGIGIGIIGGIVIAALKMVDWATGSTRTSEASTAAGEPDVTAEEVLRQQYLDGELTEDEYEQAMGDLLDSRDECVDEVVDEELELVER